MPFRFTFFDWRHGKRAVVLAGFFLFLLGGLSLFFIKTTSGNIEGINARAQRIIENDMGRASIVYGIADTLHHAASAEKDLLIGTPAQNANAHQPLMQALDKIQTDVDWMVAHVKHPDRMVLIRSIDTDFRAYRDLDFALVDNLEKGNRDESLRLLHQEIQPLRDKLHTNLFAMIASYRADIDENRASLSQEGDTIQINLLILTMLTLPLACVIVWFSVR